ncbi:peptide ABC transporter substrate-binding protein [Thioclava sp. GXIMD2076]|uniref:Peptide ABC transporter substrate-binding protein n=1 Tax=Thioclava kandeliae TaxID=3070818 RepID=A0ABV1SE83_9RHOB
MKVKQALTGLAVILALAPVLPQASLAANVPEGTKLAENQTFTFWLLDAIKSMDPQLNTDVEGSDVLRSLFEGLYNEDGEGKLVPAVATSYDLSDDKKTYTFHLRDTAKWSDGKPVTAGDFVYAWRRLADPATASEYAWYMQLMQVKNAADVIAGKMAPDQLGVTALDDHTLEVTIDTPLPYFPQMLVHTSTFPVRQDVIEEYGDNWTQPEHMVGNGAYTLTKHILGERVEMDKSDTYWDAEHTVITHLTALTINDVNQGLTRYLAGELDKVDMPAGQYPRMEKEYPDQALSTPYSCSYAYLMNLGPKGPEALKDVRVRRALSYAMNRDVIVNNVLQGGQKPAYNWTHWATAGFKMPEIDYAGWSQQERMEKAKELLKEAGYGPDHPLKLTLNYNTSEDHRKIAIAAQQFYKAVGVDLTLNNMEWKVHTDKMQSGDYEMARYAWCGDYNEPSTYLGLFSSASTQNYPDFHDDAYDAALEDSKTAADPQADYTKAEQILTDKMPIVPIYHYAKVQMLKPDIKGYPTQNVMQTWYAKDLYRVAE